MCSSGACSRRSLGKQGIDGITKEAWPMNISPVEVESSAPGDGVEHPQGTRTITRTLSAPMPLVLPLHKLRRGDLAVAGGKGANLGELVHAGFPVPDGFVVTTAAYDRFVARNHLDETITRALHDEPGSGAIIRDAFESAPIPE